MYLWVLSASVILMMLFVSSLGSLSINDFDVVLEAIWDARVKWFNLGLALGISVIDLDVIKKDAGQNVDASICAVIKLWLTQEDPRPTWAALVDALRSPMVMFEALAARIQAL